MAVSMTRQKPKAIHIPFSEKIYLLCPRSSTYFDDEVYLL